MAGGNLAPHGLGSGESSHYTAASQARICPSGPGVLGSAHCWQGWAGGEEGESRLSLGGWRSPALSRRGIWNKLIKSLLKEEGSSPLPHFGDEACRCCLNVATAGSPGCVICVLDTKILLHSLLILCFFPASMIQTLLCWVVWPAMSSILHPQWFKGRYSSSPEPVLPGSVCSSHGLPCCWLYISLNPNPFHTSGKFLWGPNASGLQASDQPGSGRGRQG